MMNVACEHSEGRQHDAPQRLERAVALVAYFDDQIAAAGLGLQHVTGNWKLSVPPEHRELRFFACLLMPWQDHHLVAWQPLPRAL